MTRFLSESLQAPEPLFRLGVRRLEAANGHPNTDIRFSTEVQHATRNKLLQLGLDPQDTTPQELYNVLQSRVRADDARLVKTLRRQAATHVSADGEVVSGMVHVLGNLADSKRCYALKPSSLKSLLRLQPPKKAMKRLGYRSLDSCLKHESPLMVMTAAWLSESPQWQSRFRDRYKTLRPSDFENRNIAILKPNFKHWKDLADVVVAQKKHNILCFKELGALILLPFPANVPEGAATVSLILALHELNEIRASSTFFKLSQVRADFGSVVQAVATDEPRLSSELLDKPMPWNLIQRYYARLNHHFREAVFEPHVQLEDMVWHPIEKTLADIEPSLAFWQHSGHLGVLHGRKPVSLNIVDAALNFCNQLPFERRMVHYFQRSLWSELLLRYLQHESVEQAVMAELQPELAAETVMG